MRRSRTSAALGWPAGLVAAALLVLWLPTLAPPVPAGSAISSPVAGRARAGAVPLADPLPATRDDRLRAILDDPLPQPKVPMEIVRRAAHPGKWVALTFDDGPSPGYTPRVLALLARYRATATFCMIGAQAAAHPEVVRQVLGAGMHLCDHTRTHDEHLAQRPVRDVQAEILAGRSALLAAAGAPVPVDWFRAPGGNWSPELQQIAAGDGLKPLGWSVDSRDWTKPGVAAMVATVRRELTPGAVVLLHDGGGRREETLSALAELLPWLVAQGYQFDVPA